MGPEVPCLLSPLLLPLPLKALRRRQVRPCEHSRRQYQPARRSTEMPWKTGSSLEMAGPN